MPRKDKQKTTEGKKSMNPNQLRTLFEGSSRLGVSYWSLYRAGEAGLIKVVRLGGRLMIADSELAHLEQFGFGLKKPRKRKQTAVAEAR